MTNLVTKLSRVKVWDWGLSATKLYDTLITRSHGKQEIQIKIQIFILLGFRTTELGWVETYNEP